MSIISEAIRSDEVLRRQIAMLEGERQALKRKTEERQDQCPHSETTRYVGSLVQQKAIQCDECGAHLRSGYDAFDAYDGEATTPIAMRPYFSVV